MVCISNAFPARSYSMRVLTLLLLVLLAGCARTGLQARTFSRSITLLDGTMQSWTFPIPLNESVVEERVNHINFRGLVVPVANLSRYVRPNLFEDKTPALYTKDDESFLRELREINLQLLNYTNVDEHGVLIEPFIPPLLVSLKDGKGNCATSSALFASMVLAARPDWKVSFLLVDLDHLLEPEQATHVMVSVDTGEGQYVIETTSLGAIDWLPLDAKGWTDPIT